MLSRDHFSNYLKQNDEQTLFLQTALLTFIYSLPKTMNFSFILSNVVVDIVIVRINAIRFIFFEADVRTFEIRITA